MKEALYYFHSNKAGQLEKDCSFWWIEDHKRGTAAKKEVVKATVSKGKRADVCKSQWVTIKVNSESKGA